MTLFSLLRSRRYRRNHGAALVVVLSLLLLLSVLLAAFMTSTRSDLLATEQYAKNQETVALAETATNLVMAQIREATLAGINGSGQGTYTWASQPGAIRVWDNAGNHASPYLYKLYSASTMKENNMSFLSSEIPPSWWTQADAYVDLNTPVNRNGRWHYPILSPEAIGKVDGFSADQTGDPSVPWDTKTSMPVRWIYLDKDGSMSDQPSNDSVGRIAFWTDDETSKVNVNTASFTRLINRARVGKNQDDSYWDVPVSRMAQDFTMGRSMPIEDEFQRYPGHPATVNLGSILKLDATFTQQKAFDLLPRYKWGGSENGTLTWKDAVDSKKTPSNRIGGSNRKLDRLLDSTDELYFNPSRVRQPFPSISGVDQETLTKLFGFFLTATSRAPDLNPFGQPQVSLWPIHSNNGSTYRTVYDNLIARCATVGALNSSRIYYFQRANPLSQTDDWQLIDRNQQLFAYLQTLTGRALPGYGGVSLAEKYNNQAAGEWDQILTEIFDFIRCVNLNETSSSRGSAFHHFTPELRDDNDDQNDRWLDSWVNTAANRIAGAGFVLPIRIDTLGTRGMGRVPTVSEVGFALFANPANTDQIVSFLLVEPSTPVMGFMPWLPPLHFSMRVQGEPGPWGSGAPSLEDSSNESSTLTQPLFPGISGGRQHIAYFRNPFQSAGSQGGTTVGGTGWISWFFPNTGNIYTPALKTGPSDPVWPFYFPRDTTNQVKFTGETVKLEGATLVIEYGINGVPYQTFHVELPTTILPKPLDDGSGNTRPPFNDYVGGIRWNPDYDVVKSVLLRDGDVRVTACLQEVPQGFFKAHPDYFDQTKRMAHSFTTRREYAYRGATFGSLISSNSMPLDYVHNIGDLAHAYHETNYHPDISPDITDLRLQMGWDGDWSTGVGTLRDGAHTMKSDDGYARSDDAQSPNYFADAYWSSGAGFFSPTKQIPSAGLFGTLPTGVKKTLAAYTIGSPADAAPWRTLVFCPNPDKEGGHIGLANTPDRYLLDFFRMPVVEPYAISEPLSTAGRINLNTQILPFTEIRRESGLYAVLSSQKVTALSPDLVSDYKTKENVSIYRFRLNIEETIKQFQQRFAPHGNAASGDLFRSPAEICSIFLIPNTFNELFASGRSGPTLNDTDIDWQGTKLEVAKMTQWWRDYRLTGDNLRERPYTQMYPLLTTKSNTYTVHVRVQAINVKGTKVSVTSEYRGSTTIERYIDPADSRIGSTIDPDRQSLEPLYRFRIVDTKQFAS